MPERNLTGLLSDLVSRLSAVERRLPPRAAVAIRVSEHTLEVGGDVPANGFLSFSLSVPSFDVDSTASAAFIQPLPAGLFVVGTFTAAGTLRLDVHNRGAGPYTLPSGSTVRVYSTRP